MSIQVTFKRTTVAAAVSAIALGAGAVGYQLHQNPAAFARLAPVASAVASSAIAPPAGPQTGGAGLPDFTGLVTRHGSAVVNITVEQPMQKTVFAQGENPFEGTPFSEFFRNMPQPPEMAPQRGLGSGFLISEDGYLLTNAHVVGDAGTVRIKLTDRREFDGKVIGKDKASDIAVVKIDARGLPFATLAKPKDLQVGEWVVAIGSPYGFENSVTAGIVSAKGRTLPGDAYVPFIQTDVAVNPGNSGGPLFNMNGEVVGINSQIFSRSGGYQGLSFAIPVDVAQRVSEQIKAHGKVTRGWLGVTIQEVNEDLSKSFKLDKPHGALVSGVAEDGPAKAAGLKSGDVIVAFDGNTIDASSDLPQLVSAVEPGSTAKLDVIRDGKPTSISVKLAAFPDKPGKILADASSTKGSKLGVVVADLNAQEKSELGIDHGVRVERVAPGAAARAGVQPGDVILQLNGKPIDSASTLKVEAGKLAYGKPAAMLVKRGDGTLFLPVKPEKDVG